MAAHLLDIFCIYIQRRKDNLGKHRIFHVYICLWQKQRKHVDDAP